MQPYLNLLDDILLNGVTKTDRTNTGTRSVFGRQIRFNLQDGFPAVTTKKLAFKAVVSELLWFIEGSTDERRLCEILHGTRDLEKKTIWTENANSPYWKPKAQYEGDVGVVYGHQWRNWRTADGKGTIDQLNILIKGIKDDPEGRRHILTAWRPDCLRDMALPPCHVMSQFYVANGKLSCMMFQRSCDMVLGGPFNIASYSLFTHMIAQVCGLEVGEFVWTIGDAHLYSNHVRQVEEQLSRAPFDLPKLIINTDVKDINLFAMADFSLENYECHPPIKADMAV